MKKFHVTYIPIGVGTFELNSAGILFNESIKLLKDISEGIDLDIVVDVPDEMLLNIDLLKSYLDTVNPDLIVLQNITFANAAYASEVVSRFDAPILLWTLREPVIDGGRLRLNSLTGAYSAANAISAFRGECFEYVFGAPSEKNVAEKISAAIKAAQVMFCFKTLKISAIGHTPQGFGFGRALDLDLLKNFGITLESIESRELIDIAKGYSDDEIAPFIDDAKKRICNLDSIDKKNVEDFARLYKAYSEYVKNGNIGAISSRCWPDFFTAFGTPVCAVLGILNDLGVAAACEADTYGALSMYVGMKLSGSAVFFGDPVSMDEKENTITYWHCGMAPCSLADKNSAAAGVHCNRKIGPTLEFGCKGASKVTVFRIGRKNDGTYRFFILKGKSLDKPKQFNGTSVVVEIEDKKVSDVVNTSVKAGWEPHFAVIFGDVEQELKTIAVFLGIEIWEA